MSKRVKWKDLANYEFLLPPKDQQAEIADLLWALDDYKVTETELLRRLVIFFDASYKAETNEDGVIYKSISELIEADELSIITGPFGTVLSARDYEEKGVAVVNPSNIKDGKVDIVGAKKISVELAQKLNKYIAIEGDLIFGRKGEVGRCAIVEEGQVFLTGSDSMRLRIEEKSLLTVNAIRDAFTSVQGKQWFERYSYGTTMPGINEKTLGKFVVPELDIKSQTTLTSIQESVSRTHSLLKSNALTIANLQRSILDSIFVEL